MVVQYFVVKVMKNTGNTEFLSKKLRVNRVCRLNIRGSV
jgi:hypothetical protein